MGIVYEGEMDWWCGYSMMPGDEGIVTRYSPLTPGVLAQRKKTRRRAEVDDECC
jgi:hypothetical protein